MTDPAAHSPLPADHAEAEKKGRPPSRQADDGKAGGASQGGKPGRRNHPHEAGERLAPGERATDPVSSPDGRSDKV